MKKRILIFGGGENQMTLINAARTLGVESCVIDPDANAPGAMIADHFEVVNPQDYGHTREVALRYKVNGIATSQMENPLFIMAQLAKELGYVFPAPEVILNCRNKFLMKQVFLKNEIPCAKGIKIEADEILTQHKIKDFTYPLIIKPVDSYSSRGVYRIKDFPELALFENQTRNFSSDRSLLIEEFIEGKEYSVESLTFRGRTSVIQITEKIITSYPYTVEMGHLQPAELTLNEKETIIMVVTDAIKALGIENSATHAELKLTSYGPVMIEIGARLGGDFISSYLTLASTGINMDEGAINIALGNEPVVSPKTESYSFIKYLELSQGKKVIKIDDWLDVKRSEGVVYASVSIKKGQVVPAITDSARRPGFVIVMGKSRTEVISRADEYIRLMANAIQLN